MWLMNRLPVIKPCTVAVFAPLCFAFLVLLFWQQKTLSGCPMYTCAPESANKNPTATKAEESDVTIFIITPTYARLTQKAELTKLSQTLQLVPNVVWILVEDTPSNRSIILGKLLERSRMRTVHLTKATSHINSTKRPKGMAQRNAGLRWVRQYAQSISRRGVVYFADDDNVYDVRLFEHMRSIRKVGVWPVAFSGGLKLERPEVSNGNVVGWRIIYGNRKFAIDMAGFAVNLNVLLGNTVEFDPEGHFTISESYFLEQLDIQLKDLEPVAADAREIFVWHTNTRLPSITGETAFTKKFGAESSNGWDL